MENPFLSIQRIQKLLAENDIPSIVIGGIAFAAWGEPRLTRDVDIKVLLSRDESRLLLDLIKSDYNALIPDPDRMLRKQGLIFIRDAIGTRLDLMLADTPYDNMAIQRGQDIEIQPDIVVRICGPEDLIIYKSISPRLRDHEDASSVIRRQGDSLNDEYVINWLEQFELALGYSALVMEYKRLRGIN